MTSFKPARVALGLLLVVTMLALTQVSAEDWPPSPGPATTWPNQFCNDLGFCYNNDSLCATDIAGQDCEGLTYYYFKRTDARVYGACKGGLKAGCVSYPQFYCAKLGYTTSTVTVDQKPLEKGIPVKWIGTIVHFSTNVCSERLTTRKHDECDIQ